MIGLHDSVPTLNRVLAEVRVGDRVYFYVTREMRLAARPSSPGRCLDSSPVFAKVGNGEIFARRIGIEMEKDGLDIPFSDIVVPKLWTCSRRTERPYSQPIWSASLSA